MLAECRESIPFYELQNSRNFTIPKGSCDCETEKHHAMPEPQNPNPPLPSASSSGEPSKVLDGTAVAASSSQKVHYPNPPDPSNPDPATLREQWRFAIKQYSRWYSHAWGTAIFAGLSFFALGWLIKGSNPLPSRQGDDKSPAPSSPTAGEASER